MYSFEVMACNISMLLLDLNTVFSNIFGCLDYPTVQVLSWLVTLLSCKKKKLKFCLYVSES